MASLAHAEDTDPLRQLEAYAEALESQGDGGVNCASNHAFTIAARGAVGALRSAALGGATPSPPGDSEYGARQEVLLKAAEDVCNSFLESPRAFGHAIRAVAPSLDVMEALHRMQQTTLECNFQFPCLAIMYIIASQITQELEGDEIPGLSASMLSEVDAYAPSNRLYILESMKSLLLNMDTRTSRMNMNRVTVQSSEAEDNSQNIAQIEIQMALFHQQARQWRQAIEQLSMAIYRAENSHIGRYARLLRVRMLLDFKHSENFAVACSADLDMMGNSDLAFSDLLYLFRGTKPTPNDKRDDVKWVFSEAAMHADCLDWPEVCMRLAGLFLHMDAPEKAKYCVTSYIQSRSRHQNIHKYVSSTSKSDSFSAFWYSVGRHAVEQNGALYKEFIRNHRSLRKRISTQEEANLLKLNRIDHDKAMASPTDNEISEYDEGARAFNEKLSQVHHRDIPRIQQRIRDVVSATLANPDFIRWWTKTLSAGDRKRILLEHMPDLDQDVLRSMESHAGGVPPPVIDVKARKIRARGNLFPRLHLGFLSSSGKGSNGNFFSVNGKLICGCKSVAEASSRHGRVSVVLHEMWFRSCPTVVKTAMLEDISVAQRCFKAGSLTWSHKHPKGTHAVVVIEPSDMSFIESIPIPLAADESPKELSDALFQLSKSADDANAPQYLWHNVYLAAKQREETWLVLFASLVDRFKVDVLGISEPPNTLMKCRGCAVCGEDAIIACPRCGMHFWCADKSCRKDDESIHCNSADCDSERVHVKDCRLGKMDILGGVPDAHL